MQYASHANNQDLVSDARYWSGTDSDTYPIEDLTRNANFALDKVVSLIFKSDRRWQWDDANNTDLNIATSDLVSGQYDYSFAVSHLKINRVRVKDTLGNWKTLEPVDRREITDTDLALTGTPTHYDKQVGSFFLHPIPNYGSTGGLEVEFQRGASYFTTADTTKEPGFAPQFHRLISLYAARDYCAVEGLIDRMTVIDQRIAALEMELAEFYATRDIDDRPKMTLKSETYYDNLY